MNISDYIIITPSPDIYESKLRDLIGRTGTIMQICFNRDLTERGAWIKIVGEPYLDEQEWYIPVASISICSDIEI